jgi:DNA-binding SARP family transcriptional activator
MRDEFEALRRQVHALAASVGQQRAMLSELGGSRVAELTTSLAELEGCAAALRNEAARLQSIERSLGDRLAVVVSEAVSQQVGEVSLKGIETLLQDRLTDVVADAVRPQLRAAIAARLPELVNEVVQPQVKAALAELHGCTTELRDEYARLRALREDLMVGFPKLVEGSVERAVARQAAALIANAGRSAAAPAGPSPTATTAAAAARSPAAVPPPPPPAPAVPAATPVPAASPSSAGPSAPPRPPVASGSAPSAAAPTAPAPPPAPAAPSIGAPSSSPGPASSSSPRPAVSAAPATPTPIPAAPTPPATPTPTPAAAGSAPPPPPAPAPDRAAGARPPAVAVGPPPGPGAPPATTSPAAPPTQPSAPTSEATPPPVVVEPPLRPAAAPAAASAPASSTGTVTSLVEPPPAAPAPPPSSNGPVASGVRYAEEAAAAAAAAAADAADGIACVLPGMVVGPSLAVGVAEALGRARLRRRRRRRAAPPAAGLYRRDPFAGHVTRRLERFARGRATPPVPPGRATGDDGWATIVVGEREAAEVGVDLSGTGLVLAGSSAADVVRAAITGLLAGQSPSTMAAVVTGDLLPAVPPFPGLAQTAAIGPALDELTTEVARRVQLLADDGAPDAGAYRAKHPDANFPMIVLAAADVGAADLERVRALFADGARAGVSGIVVAAGDDASAANLVLAPGAMVVEARPEALAEHLVGARLFRMEPQVAAELLSVLASARTDGEHMRPVPEDDESFAPATSAATAPVAVQLLGVYRIEVDGTEIKSGLRAKAKELLAFYLLHPEGATLDDAVEALWPEADPRRGSEWFWTALGNLRTKLRQATGQKELKVIDRDGDLYRIEDVFDVDLWSLQHALREGAQSRDDAVRQAALDRAVADYDGELLVGLDWFWLETPREDLRQRMVDVLVWLGDRRWASGDARAAWAALQRALEVDPFAEQIYRRIMRLQGKLSRPDDADVTYRRLVAKLQEVDLQPTPETDKLHAEVCPQT